jgi:solute carrier family 25 carnitine/acylcarnitine transporter 20/29
MSAVPTTLVTAPVERAKVLLQVQGQGGSGPQYKGVFDVMKHLYREGGLRSIFRGTGATIARDGPGSAVYVIQLLRSLRFELKADLQLLCGI